MAAALHPAAAELAEIADFYLNIETLETRKSDRLDFHEVAVWSLARALGEAYDRGARAADNAGVNWTGR